MDRTIAPKLNYIDNINIIKPLRKKTLNGNVYFELPSDKLPIIKVDLLFPAGNILDENPLVASLCTNLLTAGTSTMTAKQIAETIDFHGASINFSVSKKFSIIHVLCLQKFAEPILNLLKAILSDPIFPQEEINIAIEKNLQGLKINLEKVSFIAARKFNELVFGKSHPYGKNVELENFNNITSKQLFDFFTRHYKNTKPIVVLSGNINNTVTQNFEAFIDNFRTTELFDNVTPIKINKQKNLSVCVNKEGVQSAIRYGTTTINKYHPDYHQLVFTNTLLGGYFGSRLIKNIREEKGLTYGIYSHLHSFTETGLFYIGSDVGAEYGQATIKEIIHEIKNLQDHLVSDEEIERVKNFLTGSLLQKFDGIFEIGDVFMELKKFGLDWDYYHHLFETIKQITAYDVRNIANKYLDTNNMLSLIVGTC